MKYYAPKDAISVTALGAQDMKLDSITTSHEKAKITAAELKTIRESLGLTSQWIADIAKVQLRTAQYWEAERMAVPLNVSTELEKVEQLLDSMVGEALNGYIKLLIDQYGDTIEVPLVRYRTEEDLWKYEQKMKGLPLTVYAVYLSRLQSLLRSRGITSFTGFIDTVDYNKFIKKEQRKDKPLERALWVGNHYGKMGEEALRDILFSKFLQLSNSPLKEGFKKPITNEFCSQVLDEISNYESSREPRLKLLTFYFYYTKYKIDQNDSTRKKALDLSLHSLWKLGQTLMEQLCFGETTIRSILLLCLKDNNFQKSDFNRCIILPIRDLFSDKNELRTENLQKIISICYFLINLETNPEQAEIIRDKNIITEAKKIIFDSEETMKNCVVSFLKKNQLWNERIQDQIDQIDPQFRIKKSLENMQWHSIQTYASTPTINRSSLKNYLSSCKELMNDYMLPIGNDLPFLSHANKIYQRKNKDVLGENPENFYIFLSKSLLSRHLMIIDLSLTDEQIASFTNELQKADLNIYFTLEKQRLFLIRGLKQGLSGNYLEAVFLLMPYIENLIRTRAEEKSWESINRRGEYKTPDREAFNLFLSGIAEDQNQQLCRLLYTIIYDVPNADAIQTDRIGDNLRNESFHGLIEDLEVFDDYSSRQVQFKMIWLIMSILTLTPNPSKFKA